MKTKTAPPRVPDSLIVMQKAVSQWAELDMHFSPEASQALKKRFIAAWCEYYSHPLAPTEVSPPN